LNAQTSRKDELSLEIAYNMELSRRIAGWQRCIFPLLCAGAVVIWACFIFGTFLEMPGVTMTGWVLLGIQVTILLGGFALTSWWMKVIRNIDRLRRELEHYG
jgi:uncharacterized membrane protein AbrB (regulator of aidB expression)